MSAPTSVVYLVFSGTTLPVIELTTRNAAQAAQLLKLALKHPEVNIVTEVDEEALYDELSASYALLVVRQMSGATAEEQAAALRERWNGSYGGFDEDQSLRLIQAIRFLLEAPPES